MVNRSFREVLFVLNKKSSEQVTIRKVRFVSNKKTVENECQLLRKCLLHVLRRIEKVEGVVGVLLVFCVILVGNDGILPLVFTGRASEEEESIE